MDLWDLLLYWQVGDEILCKNGERANALADLIDQVMPGISTTTGYYDPAKDFNDGCIDEFTGWWYVTI